MKRLAYCARCALLADDVEDGSSPETHVCKECGGQLTLGRGISSFHPENLKLDQSSSVRPFLH
jgi:rRNA maturation endonuclease Nob1